MGGATEFTSTAPVQGPAVVPRREAFLRRADEPLRRIRKFLYDLNARLLYFPPEVRVSYEVEHFGTLADLRQGDYQLNVPQGAELCPISLGFVCSGERGTGRQLAAAQAVIDQHSTYLRTHGLTFTVSDVFQDARGGAGIGTRHVAFEILPRVPVTLTFDVDPHAERIRLHAWNLERLGRVSYPIAPEAINEEFLAELGRAVTREPNRLGAFAGFEVPAETRAKLQKRIYLDARRKALELAAGRTQSRGGAMLARLFGPREE